MLIITSVTHIQMYVEYSVLMWTTGFSLESSRVNLDRHMKYMISSFIYWCWNWVLIWLTDRQKTKITALLKWHMMKMIILWTRSRRSSDLTFIWIPERNTFVYEHQWISQWCSKTHFFLSVWFTHVFLMHGTALRTLTTRLKTIIFIKAFHVYSERFYSINIKTCI